MVTVQQIIVIILVIIVIYFIYSFLTGAGNLFGNIIGGIGGIGNDVGAVFNPDTYSNKSANFCCDVYSKNALVNALIRGIKPDCNNDCDHNRCNGGCGCLVSDADFYKNYNVDINSSPTQPSMNFSSPFVACDGSFTKISNSVPS